MARITVEDCIELFENRFNLVLIASYRAKAVLAGSPATIERNNDKEAVIALREIAMNTVSPKQLYENCISSYQKYLENDSPVEGLGGASNLNMVEAEVMEEILSLTEMEEPMNLDNEIIGLDESYEDETIIDDEDLLN